MVAISIAIHLNRDPKKKRIEQNKHIEKKMGVFSRNSLYSLLMKCCLLHYSLLIIQVYCYTSVLLKD